MHDATYSISALHTIARLSQRHLIQTSRGTPHLFTHPVTAVAPPKRTRCPLLGPSCIVRRYILRFYLRWNERLAPPPARTLQTSSSTGQDQEPFPPELSRLIQLLSTQRLAPDKTTGPRVPHLRRCPAWWASSSASMIGYSACSGMVPLPYSTPYTRRRLR